MLRVFEISLNSFVCIVIWQKKVTIYRKNREPDFRVLRETYGKSAMSVLQEHYPGYEFFETDACKKAIWYSDDISDKIFARPIRKPKTVQSVAFDKF